MFCYPGFWTLGRDLRLIVLAEDSPQYIEGALYDRRRDIHAHFGGQQQGGISTPAKHPYVFLFSGSSGHQHGYMDFVDEQLRLHYFGEGQLGDMQWKGGNRAILTHRDNGKRLFVFLTLGKGKQVRYFGEYRYVDHYSETAVPDTSGTPRTALVFVLEPAGVDSAPDESVIKRPDSPARNPASVTRDVVTTIRTGQQLFRRRLELIERSCRITGVSDSRYLRASHIKPWSKCDSDFERIDGFNGLLLTPNADHLFDKGYISFTDDARLLIAKSIPQEMLAKLCPEATKARRYGQFHGKQMQYLEYHRDVVFVR